MYIATIDGGTSNTRCTVWKDGEILGEAKAAVGVRNTAIDGNNHQLVAAVRDTLRAAAECAGIVSEEIALVLAAGMLTSNVGLCEIPHVTAPIRLDDLAAAMEKRDLPAVCAQPIHFIPGVRNAAPETLTSETMRDMDIMRGEETETAGLLAQTDLEGHAIFVLPGSHNKYVMVDETQSIHGCMTTLGGELLRALTLETILADTLNRSFAVTFDADAFRQGAADCAQTGLLHGAFMTRIRGMFAHYSPCAAQNYLLGLLFADELHALRKSRIFCGLADAVFVVAGSPIMQAAYKTLLGDQGMHVICAAEQRSLAGRGALELSRRRGWI